MTILSLTLSLAACSNGWFGKNENPNAGEDSGWEADSDTDADADTDTDTDADADTDSDTDTDTDPDNVDDDGDGYTENEGDCDDEDDAIGPDADEVPYDGVDNDCDEGTPDDDLDGDGFDADEDCDDEDADSNPDAEEIYGDEADNDCDGDVDELFETMVVDASCDCGAPSAIGVDSAQNVHIAYADSDTGYLKYRNKTKSGSSFGSSKEISPYNLSGEWVDLVVDGADRVQVVYTYQASGYRQVEFVYRDSSGPWSSYYIVDDYYESGSTNIGAFCSIDVDSNNLPAFAYYDDDGAYGITGLNGVPVLADYTEYGIGYAVYSLMDEHILGDVGYYTDIAIDSTDWPHIAFTDYGADEVQYMAPKNLSIAETVYGDPGYDVHVRLKSDDTPCVAFQSSSSADLMYGCRVSSGNWDIETVDSSGSTGAGAALAFDSSDQPWIAYYNETSGNLKVAWYEDGAWNTQIVDGGSSDVGAYPSIAIDKKDNVHVSYYDVTNGQLKYAVAK